MDDADPGTQRTLGIQECPKLIITLFIVADKKEIADLTAHSHTGNSKACPRICAKKAKILCRTQNIAVPLRPR